MVDFGERGKIIYIKNLQYWFCLLFIFLIVTLLIVSWIKIFVPNISVFNCTKFTWDLWKNQPFHRLDSMWGTDYIANPFFLNLKISRTTIETLRWQLSGKIIQVTFRKSSTSLVQQLKKKFE